ncbi:MAG: DUF192 domain-containing protein [Elusimicrobiales bacterium]|nr:DUF192 domain-containing protein [Elusimicrobiales bacterium]
MKILYNVTRNLVVSNNLSIADTFFKRLFGLMPRKEMKVGYGLMIVNCMSVHSCFMSFPIDVAFVDKYFRVIDLITLKPWRFSKIYFNAKHVFEFTSGYLYDKISLGDVLQIREGKN